MKDQNIVLKAFIISNFRIIHMCFDLDLDMECNVSCAKMKRSIVCLPLIKAS